MSLGVSQRIAHFPSLFILPDDHFVLSFYFLLKLLMHIPLSSLSAKSFISLFTDKTSNQQRSFTSSHHQDIDPVTYICIYVLHLPFCYCG